jgi:hypothetical protein
MVLGFIQAYNDYERKATTTLIPIQRQAPGYRTVETPGKFLTDDDREILAISINTINPNLPPLTTADIVHLPKLQLFGAINDFFQRKIKSHVIYIKRFADIRSITTTTTELGLATIIKKW